MMKTYFTANVIFLPIATDDLGEPKFYMTAGISGDLYPTRLQSAEDIKKRFEAGEIEECDMIIPAKKDGGMGDYKTLR